MLKLSFPKLKFDFNDSYYRHIATLMSGTVTAQVITAIMAPILTRLYSPQDYGMFALFSSISSIIAIILMGRYELAIILPEKERERLAVLISCFLIAFLFSLILLFFVLIFKSNVLLFFKIGISQVFVFCIILSALLIALYNALYYWFNKNQYYRLISITRILMAIVTALVSILLGYYEMGVLGLVLATILGQAIVVVIMIIILVKDYGQLLLSIQISELVNEVKRYSRFPKFLIVSHFINSLSSQMPILLLNGLYGSTVVGYFALAQRIISLPLSLISQSIGDVFRQVASSEYKSKCNCIQVYDRTLKLLSSIGILPFLAMLFLAPYLFTIVFGGEWIKSGEYTQVLSILFYLQLVSSPLSMMYMIAEKQNKDLGLQLIILVLSSISLYIPSLLSQNEMWSIVLFSFSYSSVYLINIFITRRWACGE